MSTTDEIATVSFIDYIQSIQSDSVKWSYYASKEHVEELQETSNPSRKSTNDVIENDLIEPLNQCLLYLDHFPSIVIPFVARHLRLITSYARNVTHRSAFHEHIPRLIQLTFDQLVSMAVVRSRNSSQSDQRHPMIDADALEELKIEILKFMYRLTQNYQQSLPHQVLSQFLNDFVYAEFSLIEHRVKPESTMEHITLGMCIDLCRILCSHSQLSKYVDEPMIMLHHAMKIVQFNHVHHNLTESELAECIQLLAHCSFVDLPQKRSYHFVKRMKETASARDTRSNDGAKNLQLDVDLILNIVDILFEFFDKYTIGTHELAPEEIPYLDFAAYGLIYLCAILGVPQTDAAHERVSNRITTKYCDLLRNFVQNKMTKQIRQQILSLLKIVRKHLQYNKISNSYLRNIEQSVTEIYVNAFAADKSVYKSKVHAGVIKMLAALILQDDTMSESRQNLVNLVAKNDSNNSYRLVAVQMACVALHKSSSPRNDLQNLLTTTLAELMGPIYQIKSLPQSTKFTKAQVSTLLGHIESLLFTATQFQPELIPSCIEIVAGGLIYLIKNSPIALGLYSFDAYLYLCKTLNSEQLKQAQFSELVLFIHQLLTNGLQEHDKVKLQTGKKEKNVDLDVESDLVFASLEFVRTLAAESKFFLSEVEVVQMLIDCCCSRVLKEVVYEMDEGERIEEALTLKHLINGLLLHSVLPENDSIKLVGHIASTYLQALLVHMNAFQLQACQVLSQELLNLIRDHNDYVTKFLSALPESQKKVLVASSHRLTTVIESMKNNMQKASEENQYEGDEDYFDDEIYSTGEELSEEDNMKQLESTVTELSAQLLSLSSQ